MTILTDAMSVRSEKGESIAGYLAETTKDSQPSRVFVAMKLQRYEKGEKLVVTGRFLGDHVHIALEKQTPAVFPVFSVTRAEPAGEITAGPTARRRS